jgi:molybdopterin converting factor small subunit
MADLLYFASLAETLEMKSERLELPADCNSVEALVALLRSRGEPFAGAFDGSTRILVAINQEIDPARPASRWPRPLLLLWQPRNTQRLDIVFDVALAHIKRIAALDLEG